MRRLAPATLLGVLALAVSAVRAEAQLPECDSQPRAVGHPGALAQAAPDADGSVLALRAPAGR